jgi:hypothetical protein
MAPRGPPPLTFPCAHCSREEISDIFRQPLLDLVYTAASVHRMHNDPQMVRLALWPRSLAWPGR